jgi:hypothetical protein
VLLLEQARVRECRVNTTGTLLLLLSLMMNAPLRHSGAERHVPRPAFYWHAQATGQRLGHHFMIEVLWQQSGALAITYPGGTIHGAEPVKRAETRSASQQARLERLAGEQAVKEQSSVRRRARSVPGAASVKTRVHPGLLPALGRAVRTKVYVRESSLAP